MNKKTLAYLLGEMDWKYKCYNIVTDLLVLKIILL